MEIVLISNLGLVVWFCMSRLRRILFNSMEDIYYII